jgi:hypothetical protein
MKKLTTLAFSLALFLTACATNKVDWQSRVGNYSYDQAVLEFGPPDKEATLQDGTRVSEWLTSRGRSQGGFATYMGRGLVHVSNDISPDYYLRLTFDPSGKLQSFRKYAK